ncbi:MAG: hypothetical protein UX30_C0020G0011 [Candidatus Saccharibacteria bacterium GW2011_GWA2_46_10]|nr:MAG: hypothetical protein UX30_C0020G0011 [Candidatus Saccharibacteria bacterium GW2011_GWA2_46_10]
MQHHYILIAGTISLLILTALCVYSPVHAGSVQNSFTVQAKSGGNTAKNGETISGESKSSIDITTTIDGEVVEDIHETSTDGYLRVESTVVANDTEAETTTTVATQPTTNDVSEGTVTKAFYFTDDVATATPSTIISLTETTDKRPTEFETGTIHASFFARFFSRISTTFTYVLSKLFS